MHEKTTPLKSYAQGVQRLREFLTGEPAILGGQILLELEIGNDPPNDLVEQYIFWVEELLGELVAGQKVRNIMGRLDEETKTSVLRILQIPPDETVYWEMDRAGIGFLSERGQLFYRRFLKIASEEGLKDSQLRDAALLTLVEFRKAGGMKRDVQYALRAPSEPGEPPNPITCPICGEEHQHGEKDGYRVPHCRDRKMKNKGGYFVLTHPWLNRSWLTPRTQKKRRCE